MNSHEQNQKLDFNGAGKIIEFSLDPIVILKISNGPSLGIVVHSNQAAREFMGSARVGEPFYESILVYDRVNFETALNRMTSEYYHETEILFKTPRETVVKNIGMSRLQLGAEVYVLLQIRAPKGLRVNRLRRSEMLARLDQAIGASISQHPDKGCFGVACLDDADTLLRNLDKGAYLKMLGGAGRVLAAALGETNTCNLLDESIVFFHAGACIRDERIRELLGELDEQNSPYLPVDQGKIHCVLISYEKGEYNPELGLSHKILAALDSRAPFTKLRLISERDVRRSRLTRDIHGAVAAGEMFVLYQPIVDVLKGEIASLEALVRWRHPKFGVVEPAEFIELAEELNLITEIDAWVIEDVLSQPRKYPVHVNLSTQDLLNEKLRKRLIAIIKEQPKRLILELTETTNYELGEAIVNELNEVGALLSIDDFGTGFSSMSRLTSLDVSSLKIDRSFVINSSTDVESASICISVIRLASSLNVDVIAEGVETDEQLRFLYRHGCRLIQGYVVSKPIPYESLENIDMRKFKLSGQDKYVTDLDSSMHRVNFEKTMMVEMDETHHFLRVPMTFSRFTGYTQQQLLSMELYDLLQGEDRHICDTNCALLMARGHIEDVVFYLSCADGIRKCVSVSGKRGSGADRSIYMYFESSEEEEAKIQEIKGAQGAYSTMFHEGPLAMIVWRQDFNIIDWNMKAEETFGWTRDEAVGMNMAKLLIQKSTFPDYMELMNRILTTDTCDSVNYNITKSGEHIICRWVNSAVRDRWGSVRFYISVATDITVDLLKNDQIKQLSQAVEKSGSGVLLSDSEGIIISVNRRFEEMSGYSQSELMGCFVGMLSTAEQPRDFFSDMWATISKGRTWEGEFQNKKKDGTRYWCKTTVVPVVSEWSREVSYLGIYKDLTEVKEKEEKATAMRALLMEQEKMATLGSMLAGVTHETYNYMAFVESNLEYIHKLSDKAIAGAPMDPNDLISAVEDTQEGILGIKKIMKSLKLVSRKDERPEPQEVEINQEIAMVAGLVRNEYKYTATLEFKPEEEIIHRGYPGLIRQVLMNLIINGAHAIKARNSHNLGKITLRAEKDGNLLRIWVQDNGVGMTEEVRERAFEAFFTTKLSGEGTGLGLSISKGIIEEQYSGKLLCESVPDKGTTFIIEVPDILEG